MRTTSIILVIVFLVFISGCEIDDGISQEVRDHTDYVISANDPYSCYHLKKESEINWCLEKYSNVLNTTAGCKLILNSSYSNECVTNLAVSTGDWSKCSDTLSLVERAKCMGTVGISEIMKEGEESEDDEEDEEPSTTKVTTTAPTTTLAAGTVQVQGGAAFKAETEKAMALLSKTKEYSEITNNIDAIKEHDRSGMNVYANVPTFEVGEDTWKGDPTWYAGAIAHDSYHAKLYNEAKAANGGQEPDANTWTGAVAEQKCLGYQIKVLEQIGASQDTIDYLKKQQKNPQFQNIPYENRSW